MIASLFRKGEPTLLPPELPKVTNPGESRVLEASGEKISPFFHLASGFWLAPLGGETLPGEEREKSAAWEYFINLSKSHTTVD
jgi:hypothetical protein